MAWDALKLILVLVEIWSYEGFLEVLWTGAAILSGSTKKVRRLKDGRDNKVAVDENGDEWLIDEHGVPLRDEFENGIPPTFTSKSSKSSVFTTYETSQGHCGLCGSLRCRGFCFK